jgi:hypothetical protein
MISHITNFSAFTNVGLTPVKYKLTRFDLIFS